MNNRINRIGDEFGERRRLKIDRFASRINIQNVLSKRKLIVLVYLRRRAKNQRVFRFEYLEEYHGMPLSTRGRARKTRRETIQERTDRRNRKRWKNDGENARKKFA